MVKLALALVSLSVFILMFDEATAGRWRCSCGKGSCGCSYSWKKKKRNTHLNRDTDDEKYRFPCAFDDWDTDRSGIIEPAEFLHIDGNGKRISFRYIDQNNDGEISKDEFYSTDIYQQNCWCV